MEQVVLHVDLDQFIVAVELLRRPELRGEPVLVGGTGDPTRRGVVAGASYEARESGVHSGTPLRTAAKRCPRAVFLPLDKDAYLAASATFVSALRDRSEVVEEAGWDEAYLLLDTDDATRSATELRVHVHARTGLACSVGIGDNKLRAKTASGFAKPTAGFTDTGIFRLDRRNWPHIMNERPPEALRGVGRRTATRLAEHDLHTVGDLAATDRFALAEHFGPRTGPWLVALARGYDPTPVQPEPYRPRSYGREITFQTDVTDPEPLRTELTRLAHLIAEDLAAHDLLAGRVVVKLRNSHFRTHSHGVRLTTPTREPTALAAASHKALTAFALTRPVRLIGTRAELLTSTNTETEGR
ncbi:DNA polymerase IV [Saccharopolyspora sp. NFXS83]|uniref:DNA polymerase IV n=1 Tax=Saccharopolyspora sp. NFXS83 TaxID=2993560 RepID=UPI00224B2901|nr:DNA polymerase IV [Saccharopolyspora sp. NFXS83]MCX2730564.1 DNA polymerase IV [Saccharopolyspora sp. NFXS83]